MPRLDLSIPPVPLFYCGTDFTINISDIVAVTPQPSGGGKYTVQLRNNERISCNRSFYESLAEHLQRLEQHFLAATEERETRKYSWLEAADTGEFIVYEQCENPCHECELARFTSQREAETLLEHLERK